MIFQRNALSEPQGLVQFYIMTYTPTYTYPLERQGKQWLSTPMNEPHQQFYSGNRSYHCLHTQMVVDATGIIRFIESGLMGHLNDAETFGFKRRIGTELCFPEQCVLLGDKI